MSMGETVAVLAFLDCIITVFALAFVQFHIEEHDVEPRKAARLRLLSPFWPLLLLWVCYRQTYRLVLAIENQLQIAFSRGSACVDDVRQNDPLLREAEREVEILLKKDSP